MHYLKLNSLIILFITFVFSGMTGASAQQGGPEQNKDVVILFDSSASMLVEIDGTPKIDIARGAVSDLLDSLPDRRQISLVTFGHGASTQCGNIETLVPMGQNQDHIKQILTQIKPRGFTPLSSAIEQVAEEYEGSQRPIDVILISDGGDQCFRDPCQIANKLEAANAQFTAHVIATGEGDEVKIPELKCIAEATGGRFLTPDEVTLLAVTEPNSPVIEEIPGPTLARNVTLRAVTSRGIPISSSAAIIWEVFALDNQGQAGKTVASGKGPLIILTLKPGRYRVIAREGEDARQRVDIDVPGGEPLTQDVVFANGRVNLTAHLEPRGPALKSPIFSWIISEKQNDGSIRQIAREAGASVRFTLPPGEYAGQLRGEDISVKFDMRVWSEARRDQKVSLNAGFIEAYGPPKGSWTLYRTGPSGEAKRVASEARAETTFLVAEGSYIAELRVGRERQRRELKLLAGETVTIDLRPKQRRID